MRFDVHHASTAQIRETTVHFGANAAGTSALGSIRWPELLVRKALSRVFSNRKRVPNREITINQHRHFPHGAHLVDSLSKVRISIKAVETQQDGLKCDARVFEHHPWAHAPRGIVFITDVEFHEVLPSVSTISRDAQKIDAN